jgi:hypothetical protein
MEERQGVPIVPAWTPVAMPGRIKIPFGEQG